MHIAWHDPILADIELRGVITIVVIVFAFISWISNLISRKQQGQRGQAGGRPPQPRNRELASEIDSFLEEVTGNRPTERATIELVSDEELQQRRGTTRQRRARSERFEKKPQHLERPGSNIAQRKGPGSGNLGSNLTSHLADYMAEDHVDDHVEEHLTHAVDQNVSEHLGSFSGGSSARSEAIESRGRTPDEHPIAAILRSPDGVRQAVILTEILSRPQRHQQRS